MSRAARTVFVFGVYLFGTAGVLITAPNTLLGLLGMAPTTEPWIRMLGVVVAALAAYYVSAAQAESVAFFRTSVWVRPLVLVGFICLTALSLAPPQLVAFGVVDAGGAAWTLAALRAASSAT